MKEGKLRGLYIEKKGIPYMGINEQGARGRNTGSWKTFRKLVIDKERCTKCGVCSTYCPEAAIYWNKGNFPIFDFDIFETDVCKGCKVCVKECPKKAIEVIAK
jgi:pyruvate ferredoxin oxidoreductase delta subunit